MSGANVSGLLYIDKLVSNTDNIMHLAHLVKQVSADKIYVNRSNVNILLFAW